MEIFAIILDVVGLTSVHKISFVGTFANSFEECESSSPILRLHYRTQSPCFPSCPAQQTGPSFKKLNRVMLLLPRTAQPFPILLRVQPRGQEPSTRSLAVSSPLTHSWAASGLLSLLFAQMSLSPLADILQASGHMSPPSPAFLSSSHASLVRI